MPSTAKKISQKETEEFLERQIHLMGMRGHQFVDRTVKYWFYNKYECIENFTACEARLDFKIDEGPAIFLARFIIETIKKDLLEKDFLPHITIYVCEFAKWLRNSNEADVPVFLNEAARLLNNFAGQWVEMHGGWEQAFEASKNSLLPIQQVINSVKGKSESDISLMSWSGWAANLLVKINFFKRHEAPIVLQADSKTVPQKTKTLSS